MNNFIKKVIIVRKIVIFILLLQCYILGDFIGFISNIKKFERYL